MKLTGKCKEDFEKWLLCGDGKINFEKYYSDRDGSNDPYTWFMELPKSMQYGVYEDFFDSVDILIEIMPSESKSFYWIINDNQMNSGETDTRPQARLESIKEVNKIYNEK